MCFDIGGVDHLGRSRSPVADQRPEKIFPNPALCSAHEPIIDRCRWAVLGRTIAPAATAFQHVHNATDDAAIVRSLNASYVRRQVRFDSCLHCPSLSQNRFLRMIPTLLKNNQNYIVRPEKLMSSNPSVGQVMQHHFGLTLAEALEAISAAMTNTSYRYLNPVHPFCFR